jgi:hypothetical protein
VRVLAARFTDAAAADRALAHLRHRLELGSDDASLAPLGGADQPTDGSVILAGRFRESRVPEVRRFMEASGGVVVTDVDEGWTKPRAGPASATPSWRGGEWQRTTGGS